MQTDQVGATRREASPSSRIANRPHPQDRVPLRPTGRNYLEVDVTHGLPLG